MFKSKGSKNQEAKREKMKLLLKKGLPSEYLEKEKELQKKADQALENL